MTTLFKTLWSVNNDLKTSTLSLHCWCEVTQSCLTLCNPMNCRVTGFSVHGILQARIMEWIAIPFFRGSSQPRDRTLVSCITGRFFTIWATKQNISRVLNGIFQARVLEWAALLQGIFPTQWSNPGLPHCRQMLYHLSHQGSPFIGSFN